jgi:hypothetical protein
MRRAPARGPILAHPKLAKKNLLDNLGVTAVNDKDTARHVAKSCTTADSTRTVSAVRL